LNITGLTHDGRGIGRVDGKAVFVPMTVPGDVIDARIERRQPKYDEARLLRILTPSPDRTLPFCPLYDQCGGCQLQHLSVTAQRHWKTENFMTRLTQSVEATACAIAPPIFSADTGYRRRARLGLVIDKFDKQARLGFRQKESDRLVDVEHCPVLTPALNKAIESHRDALLAKASRAPKEIRVVEADNGVFGLDESSDTQPYYCLNRLKITFPGDGFIQVNPSANEQMVAQAIDWLELQPDHTVLDLFCGVGNFTLPIAQQAKQVTGIEGVPELVEYGRHNATQNHLPNCTFHQANLFEPCSALPWFRQQRYDRILLDPGRQGAFDLSKVLGQLNAQIIVYVSCNAATLIRDIKRLETQGYRLTKAGLIDMFPHTTHTEVMVQLIKTQKPPRTPRKPTVFKF
jgi:23S rRNA (uracil1939-C5)-methyltransferase